MEKREKIAIYIMVALVTILGIIYQIFSNYFATLGVVLYEREQAAKKLHTENILLRSEIIQRSALTTINKEAREQGFIDGKVYSLP